MTNMVDPYMPIKAKIIDIYQETASTDLDIKTFTLKLDGTLDYMPGQFVELSIPGRGEAPFGFASSPLIKETLQLTIKRTGSLTDAFHRLSVGDSVFLRGPFGNSFPVDKMEGYNLFFVAGGLGLAPLRPMIAYVFESSNRSKYGKVNMLFAARTSKDHIFKYDFDSWASMPNAELALAIDRAEEGWNNLVGFPHLLVKDIPFDIDKTFAILCGPPIMIKFLVETFVNLGMPKEHIYTSLEMRMTCGVGKCGKCNVGHQYVCVDGPVFSMAELAHMPSEY